jgi:hypothetical protein
MRRMQSLMSAYLVQRKLLVGPHLGQVEGVEVQLVGLLVGHNLDEHLPLGAVPVLDVLQSEKEPLAKELL